MRSLQTSAVMFSPHWPAACRGEKSVQRRWRQSPHRPCSRGESGPHNPRSTQTPPRRKGGGHESYGDYCLLGVCVLLIHFQLAVKRRERLLSCFDAASLTEELWRHFSPPVECWGTPLEWRFFTAWPASFVSVCDAKLFKRQVRYKKRQISRILRHGEDKPTDYCVTQRVSGLHWSLTGLIIT